MTKEVLETAKRYDADVSAINKALETLGKPMLHIYSALTDNDFSFNDLDSDTACLVLNNLRGTLETRKQELIEKLERL